MVFTLKSVIEFTLKSATVVTLLSVTLFSPKNVMVRIYS